MSTVNKNSYDERQPVSDTIVEFPLFQQLCDREGHKGSMASVASISTLQLITRINEGSKEENQT